ncbi:hypothetical protein WR164_02500 [Philodulcilactobacillus myokoensis]|uniref:Uncharacterized protein n=1 Tax=Philodulcilactobacillus myokoensis TaxID=2929573 RepID=A0A9W6AZY9_9LACO|nr:hypothetical protein [Philodulcilactobacillus myokoensis]GLB46271.1 hypothetical protein WR164_02500 [Philodulcilactobacillus myokoensis]
MAKNDETKNQQNDAQKLAYQKLGQKIAENYGVKSYDEFQNEFDIMPKQTDCDD